MKNWVLRSLACYFLVLCAVPLLRADRAFDLRNEHIPAGQTMHPPLHISITSFDASSPTGNGYTPQQLRHAYGFDQLNTAGAGQIIAIVDAYGSPTIQADLDTFCAAFNIPSTSVQVYYPQGTPTADSGWATETSLDVEWAHAIAPGATIALIAARSNSYADLLGAVDYAVSLGAKQVSMSWGGSEYSTETSSDFHFNVPGVAFLVSSGDYGAGAQSPACSPYVVGVGGTTVSLNSSNNITSETAWSGSGGGASLYELIPIYQAGWLTGTKRGVPDVAYDADPATGVPLYLTGSGWMQVGGTSMSAPQWAALFALANSLRAQSISSAPTVLYSLATANYAGYYRDITSGSNGNPAGIGYDLVTGLGSPVGNQLVVALAGGFSSQVVPPVFFPPAGTYSNASAQNVTIVSATSGVSIRYTTDGSTPTETTGTLYAGPVTISANTKLNAIAYKSGTDSTITSGFYAFTSQVAAPKFSPGAGNYKSAQVVTISTTTGGAAIRYTTDGSTPTETNGKIYSGPISIGSPITLNAIAYQTGFIDSPVTDGIYTISPINVLYSFAATNNGGIYPSGGLMQGNDGNFYGTNYGDIFNGGEGTVYKVTPAGVFTTLISFDGDNGAYPIGGLVQGSDGNFYGTTSLGNSVLGTAFRITPTGGLTTLASFTGANNGGSYPNGDLVQGNDGNFYGTTYQGGGPGSIGTVFKMTPAGVLTTLVSFTGTNGAFPTAGLVQGSDGNFYGTTSFPGFVNENDYGTVFRITPAGVLTTLVSFNYTNGAFPTAALVQGSDGNFYGTTDIGGNSGDGTVFKMTPAGTLTTLVPFNGDNGDSPSAALVQDSDGNFYGTTQGGGSRSDGTVFKLTPAGILTTLASFAGTNGAYPENLVRGSDGNFYGTTESGGSSQGGVIFELITQQATAPTFSPAAGTYSSAQIVTIATTSSGASIRYTTDGSTPTETNGTLYSAPVTINSTTTLNALAYKSDLFDSTATSGTYTINVPTPAAASGGGGGGAFDDWFLGFLAFAGLLRRRRRKV